MRIATNSSPLSPYHDPNGGHTTQMEKFQLGRQRIRPPRLRRGNVGCRWTESPEFTRRKLEILNDEDRWDALLRAIEDDLMEHPERFPVLEGAALEWRVLKTRPGIGGFPGLVIYFSIESADVCVLEAVHLSDEPDNPRPLMQALFGRRTLYEWLQERGNGQPQF